MHPAQYENFLAQLQDRLESDPRVHGLILLGSTADSTLRDDLSDHDFWVIAELSALPDYLGNTEWLPGASEILFAIRHGAMRRTVIYRDRHKAEYAVFDPERARSGKIERFRVVLDRGGITELAEEIRQSSLTHVPESGETPVSIENFYVLALTGTERAQRGEILSAHRYVHAATDVLLQLLERFRALAVADPLDSRRRLEQRAPEIADALSRVMSLPPRNAITELVRIAENSLPRDLLATASARIDPIRAWLHDDLK